MPARGRERVGVHHCMHVPLFFAAVLFTCMNRKYVGCSRPVLLATGTTIISQSTVSVGSGAGSGGDGDGGAWVEKVSI